MTKLYTPDETAAIFRVSKYTVLRWARNEEIGCYKPNGLTVRFSQEHIDAKLADSVPRAAGPARNPKYAS
jgi:excisionase family DNA binding protein